MAAPVMAEHHDTSRFKLGHEGQIRTVAASVRCMPTLPRPQTPSKADKYGPLLVPVERIELPTFGLQNRCSTAELNRQTMQLQILTATAFAAIRFSVHIRVHRRGCGPGGVTAQYHGPRRGASGRRVTRAPWQPARHLPQPARQNAPTQLCGLPAGGGPPAGGAQVAQTARHLEARLTPEIFAA